MPGADVLIADIILALTKSLEDKDAHKSVKLTDEHYKEQVKHVTKGTQGNDIQFKDYAPHVFDRIRKKYLGLTVDEYKKSWRVPEVAELSESAGRSGSLFYKTPDKKFLFKTILHPEVGVLLSVLKDYYNYLRQTDQKTLIMRLVGLHRLSYGSDHTWVLIFSNSLPVNVRLTEVLDLKGRRPKPGKSFKERGRITPEVNPLKDNELARGLLIESDEAKTLYVNQVCQDVHFLSTHNLMDYSLLVGVHTLDESVQTVPELEHPLPKLGQLRKQQAEDGKATSSSPTSSSAPAASDAPTNADKKASKKKNSKTDSKDASDKPDDSTTLEMTPTDSESTKAGKNASKSGKNADVAASDATEEIKPKKDGKKAKTAEPEAEAKAVTSANVAAPEEEAKPAKKSKGKEKKTSDEKDETVNESEAAPSKATPPHVGHDGGKSKDGSKTNLKKKHQDDDESSSSYLSAQSFTSEESSSEEEKKSKHSDESSNSSSEDEEKPKKKKHKKKAHVHRHASNLDGKAMADDNTLDGSDAEQTTGVKLSGSVKLQKNASVEKIEVEDEHSNSSADAAGEEDASAKAAIPMYEKLEELLELGGVLGRNPLTGEREVYFFAIIDCLTSFVLKKKVAFMFKQFKWKKSTLSTVDAVYYGKRFSTFMTVNLLTDGEVTYKISQGPAGVVLPPGEDEYVSDEEDEEAHSADDKKHVRKHSDQPEKKASESPSRGRSKSAAPVKSASTTDSPSKKPSRKASAAPVPANENAPPRKKSKKAVTTAEVETTTVVVEQTTVTVEVEAESLPTEEASDAKKKDKKSKKVEVKAEEKLESSSSSSSSSTAEKAQEKPVEPSETPKENGNHQPAEEETSTKKSKKSKKSKRNLSADVEANGTAEATPKKDKKAKADAD